MLYRRRTQVWKIFHVKEVTNDKLSRNAKCQKCMRLRNVGERYGHQCVTEYLFANFSFPSCCRNKAHFLPFNKLTSNQMKEKIPHGCGGQCFEVCTEAYWKTNNEHSGHSLANSFSTRKASCKKWFSGFKGCW